VPLASLTDHLTSLIGDHGLYAVFGLMVIDAVLPAASELVMLYAGVVAAGALAGQHVVVFGARIDSSFWGFVAMSLAGVAGNTAGSVVGWAIGFYGGRPLIESRGRWLHLGPENLAKAERWFDRHSRRPLVRVDPGRSRKDAAAPLHGPDCVRVHALVLRLGRRGLGARLELHAFPSRLPIRGHRRRGPGGCRGGCVVCPPATLD